MEGGSSDDTCCSEPCYSSRLGSVKAKLAVVFMKELHKAYFAEVALGRFMKPRRIAVTTSNCHQKSSASSTVGSVGDVKEPKLQSTIVEEWKLNLITTLMLAFEEKCFTEHILEEEKLRTLRSLNRSLLGKILEHMDEFRNQKYSNLTCAIMMVNAARMKIPKKVFNCVLSSLQNGSNNLIPNSVAEIKRSKAFSLIKKVMNF